MGKGMAARMPNSITTDVVVIGGGITATATAYALARRGVRALLLLEQRAAASGPTGHSFGIVRTYHENRVLVTLARRSLRLYEQFEDEVGGSAEFTRAGMLVVVPEGEQEALERQVTEARRLGSSVQLLETGADVFAIEKRINLDGVAGAAYEPEAGYGNPTQASASFVVRARDLGVKVREGIRILRIDTKGEGDDRHIEGVLTDGGYVKTRCVVNAGGTWVDTINEMVGVRLPVIPYRYLGVMFRHPPAFGPTPPITMDYVNGMVMRPNGPGLTLMGPLGATAEEDALPVSREDLRIDQSARQEYHRLLSDRYPTLIGARASGLWMTAHEVTPDWQPIIGPVAGLHGFFCAVGLGGESFCLAPAVGELVARLITDPPAAGTGQVPAKAQPVAPDPRSHAYLFRPSRYEQGGDTLAQPPPTDDD